MELGFSEGYLEEALRRSGWGVRPNVVSLISPGLAFGRRSAWARPPARHKCTIRASGLQLQHFRRKTSHLW